MALVRLQTRIIAKPPAIRELRGKTLPMQVGAKVPSKLNNNSEFVVDSWKSTFVTVKVKIFYIVKLYYIESRA